jgi:hypothetical protein
MTENMFQILSNFFGGSFHYGVHSSDHGDKYHEWCRTAAWLQGEQDNHLRNAVIEDVAFCRRKNFEGKDIYVRPSFEVEENYILYDDLTPGQANYYSRRSGTLVISSSPGRMQIWQHSDRPLTNEEKKILIRNAKADESATPENRWARCPGFSNYKPKYAPIFPLSRLVSVTKGMATLPAVEACEKPVRVYTSTLSATKSVNIKRERYQTGDENRTDFRYTMALLLFGVSDEEIMHRIMSERTNWEHKSSRLSEQERYVRRTIENARKFVK